MGREVREDDGEGRGEVQLVAVGGCGGRERAAVALLEGGREGGSAHVRWLVLLGQGAGCA